MLKIGSVVMGVSDVRRAAAFWTQALGYVPRDAFEDDWMVLVPAQGVGPHVSLGSSDTPAQEHPRVHLDLYAADAADQAAEVERLVALGARRVDRDLYPDDADFVVLGSRRQPLLRHRHQPGLERCAWCGGAGEGLSITGTRFPWNL